MATMATSVLAAVDGAEHDREQEGREGEERGRCLASNGSPASPGRHRGQDAERHARRGRRRRPRRRPTKSVVRAPHDLAEDVAAELVRAEQVVGATDGPSSRRRGVHASGRDGVQTNDTRAIRTTTPTTRRTDDERRAPGAAGGC